MGQVHYLKNIQKIPASIEEAWKFFSNPNNLLAITPPFLNLKMTNELFGDEVYAGQVMTYTVKPLLGVPIQWMTEITHVERFKLFVDEQRKGLYQLWHHQHHFIATHRGNHREGDAGISAGRFDQRVARLDLAALFGTQDHGQSRTIFHRAGWIISLQFAEDHISGVARHALKANERSATDELLERRDIHFLFSPLLRHRGI